VCVKPEVSCDERPYGFVDFDRCLPSYPKQEESPECIYNFYKIYIATREKIISKYYFIYEWLIHVPSLL